MGQNHSKSVLHILLGFAAIVSAETPTLRALYLYSSSDFASPWWGSRIGYRLPDAQVIKSLALVWRNLLHRQPARATSTRGSKKHKIDGLAAAVKPAISLLKVSDIETEDVWHLSCMQVDLRTQKFLTNSRLPSPWVTKAVLTHPRGTCTRRNFSRQNGRHGDGHDSNKWMTVRSSNVQGVTETHSVFSLVTMLSLLLLLLLLLE